MCYPLLVIPIHKQKVTLDRLDIVLPRVVVPRVAVVELLPEVRGVVFEWKGHHLKADDIFMDDILCATWIERINEIDTNGALFEWSKQSLPRVCARLSVAML